MIRDYANIKPEHKISNPKLDFYDTHGIYEFSSNWFLNIKHDKAWYNRKKLFIGYTIRRA